MMNCPPEPEKYCLWPKVGIFKPFLGMCVRFLVSVWWSLQLEVASVVGWRLACAGGLCGALVCLLYGCTPPPCRGAGGLWA